MDHREQVRALINEAHRVFPKGERSFVDWVNFKHLEMGAIVLDVLSPDFVMTWEDRPGGGQGAGYRIVRYKGISPDDASQVVTSFGTLAVQRIETLKAPRLDSDYLLKNKVKQAKKDGHEVVGKYICCEVSQSYFYVHPVVAVIDLKGYKVPDPGQIAVYDMFSRVVMVDVKNLYPPSKSEQIVEHAFEAALQNARTGSNVSIPDKPAKVDPNTGDQVIREATAARLSYTQRQDYLSFQGQPVGMYVRQGYFQFAFNKIDQDVVDRIVSVLGPGEYITHTWGRAELSYDLATLRRRLEAAGGTSER